ncbi:MAG: hypothetical protein JO133_03765 [Burkholderiaceae bacterium]|nr:hypothetical protein [Burkholderiaceae bacterium]
MDRNTRPSRQVARQIDAATTRWPAAPLARDRNHPLEGSVCATMWPTRSLAGRKRWFDELYVWTEGFEASTTQRARIQVAALDHALRLLENEGADSVAVTLSFGTVERHMDSIVQHLQQYPLVVHRLAVLLRGSQERMRSKYRIRALVDYLHTGRSAVGFRITEPRAAMEMRALDLVQPDFAKVLAPASNREEFWADFVSEARIAGITPESLIVAGLGTERQVELARAAGAGFGQGTAVRPAFRLPDSDARGRVASGSALSFLAPPTVG